MINIKVYCRRQLATAIINGNYRYGLKLVRTDDDYEFWTWLRNKIESMEQSS